MSVEGGFRCSGAGERLPAELLVSGGRLRDDVTWPAKLYFADLVGWVRVGGVVGEIIVVELVAVRKWMRDHGLHFRREDQRAGTIHRRVSQERVPLVESQGF